MTKNPPKEPSDDENAEFYFSQSRRLAGDDDFRLQYALTGGGIGCFLVPFFVTLIGGVAVGWPIFVLIFITPYGWGLALVGLALGTVCGMGVASIFDKYRIVRKKPLDKDKP